MPKPEFNKHRGRILAIDFDGVLHQYSKGWWNGSIYDPPTPGAAANIKRLVGLGYNCIVFTCREDHDAIRVWLAQNEFPALEITAVKPPAIAYIDDRALRFTDWDDIGKYFG